MQMTQHETGHRIIRRVGSKGKAAILQVGIANIGLVALVLESEVERMSPVYPIHLLTNVGCICDKRSIRKRRDIEEPRRIQSANTTLRRRELDEGGAKKVQSPS